MQKDQNMLSNTIYKQHNIDTIHRVIGIMIPFVSPSWACQDWGRPIPTN